MAISLDPTSGRRVEHLVHRPKSSRAQTITDISPTFFFSWATRHSCPTGIMVNDRLEAEWRPGSAGSPSGGRRTIDGIA